MLILPYIVGQYFLKSHFSHFFLAGISQYPITVHCSLCRQRRAGGHRRPEQLHPRPEATVYGACRDDAD